MDRRPDWTPAWRVRRIRHAGRRLRRRGERRLLWLPVFFGAGIGVYFALTVEPPLWPGVAARSPAGGRWPAALRRYPAGGEAALALAVFAAGFALMPARPPGSMRRRCWSAASARSTVTGRVVDIDLLERGWRLIVAPDPLPGLDAGRPAAASARSTSRAAATRSTPATACA